MAKKLTCDNVSSVVSKKHVMRRVYLTDVYDEDWEVDIDVNANPIYVDTMVKNILRLGAQMEEAGILDEFDLEKNWSILYYVEFLKHYTSLEIDKLEKKNDVKSTISNYQTFISNLISLGLFEKIINCFEQNAQKKIMELFCSTLINMNQIIQEETDKILYESSHLDAQSKE